MFCSRLWLSLRSVDDSLVKLQPFYLAIKLSNFPHLSKLPTSWFALFIHTTQSSLKPDMGSRYRTWDRESEVGPSWNHFWNRSGSHGSRSGIGNRNNLESKVESLEKLLLMMWNQLWKVHNKKLWPQNKTPKHLCFFRQSNVLFYVSSSQKQTMICMETINSY